VRILVTGAAGMLGRAVTRCFEADHEPVGIDLADGDLASAGVAARLVAEASPEWIIHCAAWTDVDGAESARREAMAANADATGHLAGICRQQDIGLTYLSTDYVFDGQGNDGGYDEGDPRDPLNHYGLTKARGEEHVESLPGDWQIVRTSWLFGDGRVNFPKTIVGLLDRQETLQVVDDQRGCPTYADDLAELLHFLVPSRRRGIFHGTNAGDVTWYGFAREVAAVVGKDPGRITPCASSVWPTAAVRPPCSVLRSGHLEKVGCPARPSWQDAVARYLARLEAGSVAFP